MWMSTSGDVVAAAAVEVAGAAGRAARRPDVMGDLLEIDGLPGLPLWELLRLARVHRVPRAGREFLVGAGRVVAHQAVDVLRLFEVEAGVLPAVSGVAAGAAGPVPGQTDTEIVQCVDLAEFHAFPFDLLGSRPCPVDGLHEIRGFLLVALEALLCDFGARLEVHVADQVDMAGQRRRTERHPRDENGCRDETRNLHKEDPPFLSDCRNSDNKSCAWSIVKDKRNEKDSV